MEDMEDAAELFMEGVDHTTGHWDQIKGHTGKAFGRSRRQSGGGSGREKSKRDVDDDRTFQYDNDRDDPRRQSIGDFDGRRGRQGSDDWDARQYASPQMSQARYGGRPGMQRRTSSLDRQQFPDGRVARYREPDDHRHPYDRDHNKDRDRDRNRDQRKSRRDSPDDKDTIAKLKRKGQDYLNNDMATAVATGVFTVGTVFAASKLYDSYKGKDKGKENQRGARSRSRRRR